MTLGQPRPQPTPESEQFWAGSLAGELRVQHCDSCGHDQLYPRLVCTRCHAQTLSWRASAGTGTVYAVTVVRRAPNPALADDIPYAIALVELDEGPRLMANIVGTAADDVAIGDRMTVDFDDEAEGVRVPRFRPVGNGAGDG
jgi:uncharacterized OB-fold protein